LAFGEFPQKAKELAGENSEIIQITIKAQGNLILRLYLLAQRH
jgi:hypothetical protein